ncbi:unnamed protein product [Rhizophagus irregularis]|nr:unnamed protein product [Rhizophagus irregularis]
MNRQFSQDTINKYFKRLRQLLKDKLLAIKNRLSSQSKKNRQTKTYIRFSSGTHVIYLGFYLPCGAEYRYDRHDSPNTKCCSQPTAFVLSQNRWHCNEHLEIPTVVVLFDDQPEEKFPKNPDFYQNISHNGHNHGKEVHSTRLGVKYDIIIKKYNKFRGQKDKQLKEVMEPTELLGIPTTHLYYKEYKIYSLILLASLNK